MYSSYWDVFHLLFSCFLDSGAQGEYAGLCAIMAYLHDHGETQRDVSNYSVCHLVSNHLVFLKIIYFIFTNLLELIFQLTIFPTFWAMDRI